MQPEDLELDEEQIIKHKGIMNEESNHSDQKETIQKCPKKVSSSFKAHEGSFGIQQNAFYQPGSSVCSLERSAQFENLMMSFQDKLDEDCEQQVDAEAGDLLVLEDIYAENVEAQIINIEVPTKSNE